MKHWISPFPSYQGYRTRTGAGYIRYDHDISWYTPIDVLDGTAIAHLEVYARKAYEAGAFYGTRLIWNHVNTNRALPGCKVIQFQHSDGRKAFVCDIRDRATLDLMMEVEQKEADAVGHLRDFRQFGFGILNENEFFGNPCPFTTEEIIAYYSRMKAVWNRKLMICVGGIDTYMTPFLNWLGQQGDERPQAVFNDHFHREGWSAADGCTEPHGGDTYSRAEAALGYKPLIWWCETTGDPDGLPVDEVACLYRQFVDERGVFFANMGEIPTYAGTAEFAEKVTKYAPERMQQFLEWSRAGLDESGEESLLRRAAIEEEVVRLRDKVGAVTRQNEDLRQRIRKLESD
jgi:hypothetical protein